MNMKKTTTIASTIGKKPRIKDIVSLLYQKKIGEAIPQPKHIRGKVKNKVHKVIAKLLSFAVGLSIPIAPAIKHGVKDMNAKTMLKIDSKATNMFMWHLFFPIIFMAFVRIPDYNFLRALKTRILQMNKITLYYDENVHIYQKSFDEENVHIKIKQKNVETKVSLNKYQTIGLSKALIYDDFKKQSEVTDKQIETHVRKSVKARIGSNNILALFGFMVYGSADDPEEKQIEAGIAYYKQLRDKMKTIVDGLNSKGTKVLFGLEEICKES